MITQAIHASNYVPKKNIGTSTTTTEEVKGSTKIEANMPSKGSPEVVQVSPLLPRPNINATVLNRYGIISCISQTNQLHKCLMVKLTKRTPLSRMSILHKHDCIEEKRY